MYSQCQVGTVTVGHNFAHVHLFQFSYEADVTWKLFKKIAYSYLGPLILCSVIQMISFHRLKTFGDYVDGIYIALEIKVIIDTTRVDCIP